MIGLFYKEASKLPIDDALIYPRVLTFQDSKLEMVKWKSGKNSKETSTLLPKTTPTFPPIAGTDGQTLPPPTRVRVGFGLR